MNNTNNTKLHPMIMTAAAAVILVSGVGVAAILGWLPSSNSKNPDPALAASAPAVVEQSSAPATAPATALRESVREAAREPAREPVREPVRERPAVVKQAPVKSAPAVCHNCGVIQSISAVDQRAEGSGVGAVGGALVGGLLGNQVGGGNGRKLATVAGAIGGAVAGNQIEGHVKATRTYNISVRLDDGSVRTLQQSEQPNWREGDRVRIVNGSLRADS